MAYFRLYVFDRDSHAIQSFDLIAGDRALAVRRARHEMLALGGLVCELWEAQPARPGVRRGWSLAYKHKRDEAASAQSAGSRLSG